jgi:hypothetical protein
MKTNQSAAAIARIRNSFRAAGMTPPQVTACSSTIIHIWDGACGWFARAFDVADMHMPANADDRHAAYSDWASSHAAMTEAQIPRNARNEAKALRLISQGW